MRPPPDAPTVLGRVARFLAKEVQVEDKAQAFRLKVAAFLIAAVARNGCIGRGNALLCHLPEDQRHFRRATLGAQAVDPLVAHYDPDARCPWDGEPCPAVQPAIPPWEVP